MWGYSGVFLKILEYSMRILSQLPYLWAQQWIRSKGRGGRIFPQTEPQCVVAQHIWISLRAGREHIWISGNRVSFQSKPSIGQMIGRAPVFDTGAISPFTSFQLFWIRFNFCKHAKICVFTLITSKLTPFHFVKQIFWVSDWDGEIPADEGKGGEEHVARGAKWKNIFP